MFVLLGGSDVFNCLRTFLSINSQGTMDGSIFIISLRIRSAVCLQGVRSVRGVSCGSRVLQTSSTNSREEILQQLT